MHKKYITEKVRVRKRNNISSLIGGRLLLNRKGHLKIITILSLVIIVISTFAPVFLAANFDRGGLESFKETTETNQYEDNTYSSPSNATLSNNSGENSSISSTDVDIINQCSIGISNTTDVHNHSSTNSYNRIRRTYENSSQCIQDYTNISVNDSLYSRNTTNTATNSLNITPSVENHSLQNESLDGNYSHNLTKNLCSIDNKSFAIPKSGSYSDDRNLSYQENGSLNVPYLEEKKIKKIIKKIDKSLSRGKPVFLILDKKDGIHLYSNLEDRYGDKVTFVRIVMNTSLKNYFKLSYLPTIFLIRKKTDYGLYNYMQYKQDTPDYVFNETIRLIYENRNIVPNTPYGYWYNGERIEYHDFTKIYNQNLRRVVLPLDLYLSIENAGKYLNPNYWLNPKNGKVDPTMFSSFKVIADNFHFNVDSIIRAYLKYYFDGITRLDYYDKFHYNFFFDMKLKDDDFSRKIVYSPPGKSGIPLMSDYGIKAMYSDDVPWNSTTFNSLIRFADNGGYDTTHALMALMFLKEKGGYDKKAIDDAITHLCQKIVKEQIYDDRQIIIPDFDLYAERVLFLLITGHKEVVKDDWIKKIIAFQNKDGGFPLNYYTSPSHGHSTFVALLALLSYNKYVLLKRPCNFEFLREVKWIRRPLTTNNRVAKEVLKEVNSRGSTYVIAKLGKNASNAVLSTIRIRFGKYKIYRTRIGEFIRMKLNKTTIKYLDSFKDIIEVIPDEKVCAKLTESLPIINYTNVTRYYNYSGKNVTVVILDTGLNQSYVNYTQGYDFVNDDSIPDDDNGHGTQIALVIKSMAPNATIIPVKVLDSNGYGNVSTVMEGLSYSISIHPDIIVMAFGGGSYSGFADSDPLCNLSNYAVNQGIFVIASAGNDGSKNITAPAAASKVFRVASTTDNDNIASFSNINPTVDVFAPGVNITTQFGTYSGTSMSAAHVAGAAALIIEAFDHPDIAFIKDRLKSTGKPISYTYNSTLTINISRIDIYNAIANKRTMIPYDYSNWWQCEPQSYDVVIISSPVVVQYDIEGGGDVTPPSSHVNSISPYWKKSSPITITATATDDTAVDNVKLYYSYSSDNSTWTSWTNYGTDSSSPWSWSFNFPKGQGHYRFYSIATDTYGNTESAPSSADAICGYDTSRPSSSVNSISPYWYGASTSSITITVTASDSGPSGIKQVTLYYRHSLDNSTWSSWYKFGSDSSFPYSLSFNFPNNTGYYEFYSIAEDNAGNIEPTSTTADAKCGYDTFIPSSYVNEVSPYNQISPSLNITSAAGDGNPDIVTVSGIKQVTLYYRYSSDNSSWNSWQSYGTDTSSPWSWSFDFPSGNGYYEFYSIAEDNAGNVESAPASADARCHYNPSTNTPPIITNESPLNDSTGVSIQPTCRVQVNESDGDTLTVYWYENTTGVWVLRNVNNSVPANSTVSFRFVQFNSYGTTYYWKVAVNDGTDNVTAIYHFTTNHLPSVSNVIITASHNFTLDDLIGSGTYYDADSDPESGSLYQWWTNESGVWQKIPGATFKILDANLTKEGCWYKFEYTPCDGTNYGTPVNSTPFQVRPLTETATYSGNFNISGNLTVANGGTLYLGASTLIVQNIVKILSGGTFNGGSGTHRFGSLFVESGGVFNATSGVTYLNGKDANSYVLDIDGAVINNSGTVEIDSSGLVYMDANPSSGSLFDLIIKLVSQTSTVMLQDDCIVGGNLTIDDGILDTNNNILNVKNRLYILSGGALNCTGDVVDHKVGSIYMDTFSSFEGSAQSKFVITSQYGGLSLNILGDFISNGVTIELRTNEISRINIDPSSGGVYDLIINSSSIVEWEGSLNVLNNLTIISGTLRPFVGSNDITVGNTVIISAGTLGGNSASGIWSFGSIIQNSGTIYATSRFINITGKSGTGYALDLDGTFVNNSCRVRIKSNSNANIDISPLSGGLYDLVIDTNIYKITSVESSIVSHNLSVSSGTFELRSNLSVSNLSIGDSGVFNITNGATLSMSGILALDGGFNIINGNATGINLGGTLFDLCNAVNISLQNVLSKPSDPSNLRNIGKYVNITSCGLSSITDINITYSDSDLGTVDESSLRMYEYNSSTLTWSMPSNTGVNISSNHVWAIGVANFSIYAPLGEIQNNPPIINSIDLRNSTGSKLNSMIDVNKEYYFLINVTDPDGWEDVNYINITAWYDNGNESSYYNQTLGGNLNLFLQYKNITGIAEYRLIWPKNEVEIVLINCSETIINPTTREVKISFKPKSQFRYAPGDGAWNNTANMTDDLYSWNVNVSVEDNHSAEYWVVDEFGVYRYVNIEVPSNWIGVSALPGYSDDSDTVTITYSSNYDYKVSIWFSTNLVNQSTGSVISVANNVYILANADLNDDVTSDIVFSGTGESNAVEIINASGTFKPNGTYQTVNVRFRVYIPFGTLPGEYRANTITKIEIKTTR